MFKMIIGLFTGMLLTGLLYNTGIMSPAPMMAQSDSITLTETLSDLPVSYHKALTSALQKVDKEIKDKEIAQFYQKLRQEYELDKPSSGTARSDNSSLMEMLPDIKKINHIALTLPLQEAGRNIQDKEIAQFYYRLLKNVGWAIEPD